MRYILISAAAAMALAGAATLGNAQGQDNEKNRGPAAEGKAPGSGGAERAPGGGEPDAAVRAKSHRTEVRTPQGRGRRRQTRVSRGRPSRTTRIVRSRRLSRSATRTSRSLPNSAIATPNKQKSTDQRKGDKDKQKSTDQRKGDQRQAEVHRPAAPARSGQAEGRRPAQGRQRQAEVRKRLESTQAGRVQVSEEKRSGVRERLVKERRVDRVQRSRINVSINIGTTLPRSVRLHRFPTTIVSFEPAYREYSYVLLDDETIVIVDERTYVIVDVIPAGSQRADRPGRAHLTLSSDDMRFIYRTVPKNRTANVRIRLALGAEVPRDVELYEFPGRDRRARARRQAISLHRY